MRPRFSSRRHFTCDFRQICFLEPLELLGDGLLAGGGIALHRRHERQGCDPDHPDDPDVEDGISARRWGTPRTARKAKGLQREVEIGKGFGYRPCSMVDGYGGERP